MALVVGIILSQQPSFWWIALCIIVFQFVTVTYAVYAFVLTLSVVLLSTPVASMAAVDAQRVAYTLAGALMIVIGSIVAMPLIRRRRPLP